MVQTITEIDFNDMMAVQNACYYDIEPETLESMACKIRISPDTCFIAKDKTTVQGYLLSIPSILGKPPQLNMIIEQLESNPNCLYLHDLAIHPNARGLGIGKLLFSQFVKAAYQKQFEYASLVSIQNSVPFWEKHGFSVIKPNNELQNKLKTYGDNAAYMECFLPDFYPK